MAWFTLARARYGDRLLGIYFQDEPGGKQLDSNVIYLANSPTSYMDYANNFYDGASAVRDAANLTGSLGASVFTSDYGLYWFDYEAGYDTVLAEFGSNNSRTLQIDLARGAAEAQNKEWGVMITWTYNQPPYLESATQLYNDMVLAYNSGAEYIAIYDASQGYLNTTLTPDHYMP